MNLGELIAKLQKVQMSWTDDTGVYIHIDTPMMFAVQEVYEDEEQDCIVIATHPWGS